MSYMKDKHIDMLNARHDEMQHRDWKPTPKDYLIIALMVLLGTALIIGSLIVLLSL